MTWSAKANEKFIVVLFDAETGRQIIGATVCGDYTCLSCLYQEYDFIPREEPFEEWLAEADLNEFCLLYRPDAADLKCAQCEQLLGEKAPIAYMD